MNTSPNPHTEPAARLLALDWLRIGALAWLIVYHVLAYYARWPWHVNSPFAAQTGPWVEPLMRLSSPWRMSLLFLVSGAVTALLLQRHGASGALLRSRAKRLLLPLLLGVVLVVPPQSWLEVRDRFGYGGSLIEFMALYLTGDARFVDARGRLILPTWNHLWFLPYLFVYTLAVWALVRRWPAGLGALSGHATHALRGWRLALWPLAVPLLSQGLVQAGFARTHALVDDPSSHLLYGAAFGAGAVLASAPLLWTRLQRWRWPALGLALAGWALTLALPRTPLALAGLAVQTWAALVAVLGFAHRHLQRDPPWRAPLAEAVFPVYLVHQTVIIVVAVALRPLALPPLAEGLLLVTAAATAGVAFHRLAATSGGLRPWVGMGPAPRAVALRESAL